MRQYALVLLVTAAVTYLLTPLVRRIAVGTRAMHAPRARDTHTEPTPLLGGLAMYGGLVAGLLVATRLSFLHDPFQAGSKTGTGLVLAGGLIVVVGFVDDRWGLSAISKLAGQVAAAGILVWSGQALPWVPMPSGRVFSLEPDLSVTLTILLVVITINAINFIDGLDGLAAGIVAVAALSFLAYSYALIRTIGNPSQGSLPAVASALLAGVCIGFLPHNFYPARIFMGDIGAGLLGLILAYCPIASTDSLDPTLLTNYSHNVHALDRFPTFLPLLVPAAIFIIPYADLMFAVIRRARAGKPLMAADRQHLHHRLLNIGHSYRQSVLIMYLWAALFSVTVVSLSVVRTKLAVLAAATVVAILALLPVTMPSLRPWRSRHPPTPVPPRAASSRPAPTSSREGAPYRAPTPPADGVPYPGPVPSRDGIPYPGPVPSRDGIPYPGPVPSRDGVPYPGPGPLSSRVPGSLSGTGPAPSVSDPLPHAGRLPADPLPAAAPFPAPAQEDPALDPLYRPGQVQHPDARPRPR